MYTHVVIVNVIFHVYTLWYDEIMCKINLKWRKKISTLFYDNSFMTTVFWQQHFQVWAFSIRKSNGYLYNYGRFGTFCRHTPLGWHPKNTSNRQNTSDTSSTSTTTNTTATPTACTASTAPITSAPTTTTVPANTPADTKQKWVINLSNTPLLQCGNPF